MNTKILRMTSITLVGFGALVMCGCSIPDGNAKSYQARIQTSRFITESSRASFQAARPVAEWWDGFDDKILNNLVRMTVTNNLDIRAALANLRQARSVFNGQEADRFPQVDSAADYFRKSSSLTGNQPVTKRDTNTYTAGFDAVWEIDFWGRVSERVQKAQEYSFEVEADLQAVYVSVIAEVARFYMELRGAQRQLAIAQSNAANQQKTYELVESLRDAGGATDLDTTRALAALESTQALIPQLEARVDTAIYRLSVLTGKEPNALYKSLSVPEPLPSLPVKVLVGDPQDLLERRPDIRRAHHQLNQALSDYRLAKADWFPQVNMIGGIGFLSASLSDLARSDSVTSSIGPSISWRILDFKRLRAAVIGADARVDRVIADYQNVILRALEDVQAAMTRFNKEQQSLENLRRSAVASDRAAAMARVRFEGGLDGFINVLDAERSKLVAQNAVAESETRLAVNLVALYKSLGGGW